MDPDEALRRIRLLQERLTRRIEEREEKENLSVEAKAAEVESILDETLELCETVRGLDQWLNNKGFLPKVWER